MSPKKPPTIPEELMQAIQRTVEILADFDIAKNVSAAVSTSVNTRRIFVNESTGEMKRYGLSAEETKKQLDNMRDRDIYGKPTFGSLGLRVGKFMDTLFASEVSSADRIDTAKAINKVLGVEETDEQIKKYADNKEAFSQKLTATITSHEEYPPEKLQKLLVQARAHTFSPTNPLRTYATPALPSEMYNGGYPPHYGVLRLEEAKVQARLQKGEKSDAILNDYKTNIIPGFQKHLEDAKKEILTEQKERTAKEAKDKAAEQAKAAAAAKEWRLDHNGDGIVSGEEARRLANKTRNAITSGKTASLLHLDQDNDGDVDAADIRKINASVKGAYDKGYLEAIAKMLEKNPIRFDGETSGPNGGAPLSNRAAQKPATLAP